MASGEEPWTLITCGDFFAGAFSWLLEALGARVTYGYGSWQVESGEWVEPFQHIVLAVELPRLFT